MHLARQVLRYFWITSRCKREKYKPFNKCMITIVLVFLLLEIAHMDLVITSNSLVVLGILQLIYLCLSNFRADRRTMANVA